MFEDRQRADGKWQVLKQACIRNAFENVTDLARHLGKPVSHAFAKELLAGIAGAEVDKLAETKGEDFFDRERAKHEAKKRSEQLYDSHYGGQDQYDP